MPGSASGTWSPFNYLLQVGGRPKTTVAPWPKFRANLQNTGQGIGFGASGSQKWSFKTNGEIISSPAIGADGTVYIGSDDANLYAIDSGTGIMKWSYAMGAAVESSPLIGPDGTIYVGCDDGKLYAINASTRLPQWTPFQTGAAILSSPTISNGLIYFGSNDAKVYALRATDGALIWTFQTSGQISSPAIGLDGTVYVGSTDGNVYALDPNSGIKKSSFYTGTGFTSPAIGTDGTVYVGCNNGYCYALDPANLSTPKWSFLPPNSGYVYPIYSSPTVGGDGTVYIASYNPAALYALSGSTGLTKWSTPLSVIGTAYQSSPAIAGDGTIYVGGGISIASISSSGTLNWTFNASPYLSSPAIGADGVVYFGATDGSLHAIESGPQAEVLYLSRSSVTGLAAVTGQIVLSRASPAGGEYIYLSTDIGSVSVPGSIFVPAGARSTSFRAVASPVVTSTTAHVTATVGLTSVYASLNLVGIGAFPSSISLPSITGGPGNNATGTLSLSAPAPSTGLVVSLSSSNPGMVSVPASITVPAGQSSVTFPIAAPNTVSSTVTVRIKATAVGVSVFASVNVYPYSVSVTVAGSPALAKDPNVTQPAILAISDPAQYFDSATVTVNLSDIAPSAGFTFQAYEEDGNLNLIGPATVTVPPGQKSVSFKVGVNQADTQQSVLSLYLYYFGGNTQNTINVYPLIPNLSIANDPYETGGISFPIDITLLAGYSPPYYYAAPANEMIYLSSNSSVLKVPASVTMPTGSKSFAVQLHPAVVNTVQHVMLTANFNGNVCFLPIDLKPAQVSGLSLSSYAIVGGSSLLGTVQLNAPAGAGGSIVHLTSNPPGLVTVPALSIPAGARSITFPISTVAVTSPTSVLLNACTWQGSNVGDTQKLGLLPRK